MPKSLYPYLEYPVTNNSKYKEFILTSTAVGSSYRVVIVFTVCFKTLKETGPEAKSSFSFSTK